MFPHQAQDDDHRRHSQHYQADFNLYTLSAEEQKKIKGLPKSLEEALDALETDHEYLTKGGVFPQRLIDVWISRKRAEARQVSEIPTPAEFAMYYDL